MRPGVRRRLERRLDAFGAAGIPDERICLGKKSGATVERPGLTDLLAYARPGDTIVVHTLDASAGSCAKSSTASST
nr:recombinase family protein [Streptomyces adustus]